MIILFAVSSRSIQPIDPSAAVYIPPQCRNNCTSDYGSPLGSSYGVKAYSNCNSELCFNFQDAGVVIPASSTGFKNDVYTGMRWQCVQYARRWMVIIYNVTFGQVNSAFEIFELSQVLHLPTGRSFKFYSFQNQNERPPLKGDLIIYKFRDDSPDGHVAVVVDVNLFLLYVQLAQQNYQNQIWKSNYSRRVRLQINTILSKNYYKVTDQQWPQSGQPGLDVRGWKSIVM